jgi:hypothetical protein
MSDSGYSGIMFVNWLPTYIHPGQCSQVLIGMLWSRGNAPTTQIRVESVAGRMTGGLVSAEGRLGRPALDRRAIERMAVVSLFKLRQKNCPRIFIAIFCCLESARLVFAWWHETAYVRASAPRPQLGRKR